MTTQNPARAPANPSDGERVQPDGPLSGAVKRGGANPSIRHRRHLAKLLVRIETADGPDRELDARVHAALLSTRDEPLKAVAMKGRGPWPSCGRPWFVVGASGVCYQERWLTRSVDEALAMVERFFPGSEAAIYTGWALKRHGTEIEPGHWSIPKDAPRGCWVRFYGGEYLGPLYNATCEAANPALALTGALLNALILQARMDTEDEPLSHRQARANWKRMTAGVVDSVAGDER